MKPEIAVTMDLLDPAEHHVGPLDDAWYDSVFGNCAVYGVSAMYWRVSLGQAYYHSKILKPVNERAGDQERFRRLAEMLCKFDPLEKASNYARKHGVRLLAWFPFNETHVVKRSFDLSDPWYARRRDLFWRNRDDSRAWLGLPCVAEPEVVDRTRAIVDELCGYDIDAVYVPTRTHCYRPGACDRMDTGVSEDEFGFNDPIRQRFLERHGRDICREDFDVDAWHRIKGEFLTEFVQALGEVAHTRGKSFCVGVSPDRLTYVPNLAADAPANHALRVYHDWERWSASDEIDGMVAINRRERAGTPRVGDCDIRPMHAAVPEMPITIFQPTLAFRPRVQRDWYMGNFELYSLEKLGQMLRVAVERGSRGLILQGAYLPLFTDTDGKDIGCGVFPRQDYRDAIARWSGTERRP